MPTYEYACTTCGHRLEAVQKFTDDPLTECSECGGPLRKVYGNVGIVLKGSGFYKTDSRAAANGNGNGKRSSDGDSSGDKGEKSDKTDSSKSEKSDSSKSEKGSDSSSKTGGSSGNKEAKPSASATSSS